MSYATEQWNQVKQSLKALDWRVALIMVYDFLFYTSVFFLLGGFRKFLLYIAEKYSTIPEITQEQIAESTLEQISPILSGFQGVYASLIGGIVVLALALFFSFCFFKGMIWLTIGNKKLSKKFMLNFFLVNAIWTAVWILIVVTLFLVARESLIAPALVVLGILLIHFTHILYTIFTEEKKIKIFKGVLTLGVKKIHFLIVPYLVVGIGTAVIFGVLALLSFVVRALPENVQTFIAALFFLGLFAWVRIYLYGVVKKLYKL